MKQQNPHRNIKSLYEVPNQNRKQISSGLFGKESIHRNSTNDSQFFYSTHISSPFFYSNNFTSATSFNKMITSNPKINQTFLPFLLNSTQRSDFSNNVKPKQPKHNQISYSRNLSKQPLISKSSFLETRKQELKQQIQSTNLRCNVDKFKLATEPNSTSSHKLQKFIRQVTLNNLDESSPMSNKLITRQKNDSILLNIQPISNGEKIEKEEQIENDLIIQKPQIPYENEERKQTIPRDLMKDSIELKTSITQIEKNQEPDSLQNFKGLARKFFPKISQPRQSQVTNSIFSIVLSQEFQKLKEDSSQIFLRKSDLIICDNLYQIPKKGKQRNQLFPSKKKKFFTKINITLNDTVQLNEKAFLRKINQIFQANYIENTRMNQNEDLNLDMSILSDGYKEIKSQFQHQCKVSHQSQFRLILQNQISSIPSKQQNEQNFGQVINESPLDIFNDDLDEDKHLNKQESPQIKKVLEKKKILRKQIMVHLWCPGQDKVTTTFNIPNYFQPLQDQQSDIKKNENQSQNQTNQEEMQNIHLSKPKNVFQQAIKSLISKSQNQIKTSSSILKIAGISDEINNYKNADDLQTQQSFSQKKVNRYAKLFLQYKIKKIFQSIEQTTLVLLQYLTVKNLFCIILNNESTRQQHLNIKNLTNYIKQPSEVFINLINTDTLKIPSISLQIIKFNYEPTEIFNYNIESISPNTKSVNDSNSPSHKNDQMNKDKCSSQNSLIINQQLQEQDEVEQQLYQLSSSKIIQTQREIQNENKIIFVFFDDVAQFKKKQKDFIVKGENSHALSFGQKLQQAGWRTDIIQVIVSTLNDQTRNSMLSQQMSTNIEKKILQLSISNNNLEIKFRSVNNQLDKLDGKCRQLQLLKTYEKYQELLNGEFEDNFELQLLLEEIEFVSQDRIQIQIPYRASHTLNFQASTKKDESFVEIKHIHQQKESPSKARINRLRSMLKGDKSQINQISFNSNQNTMKLSPYQQKRETGVQVKKILKKATLMDSQLPNTTDIIYKLRESINEQQIFNEEISSHKFLQKFDDTNTNESDERLKQEKKDQYKDVKNQRRASIRLPRKANRYFEKNQSMTKYSFMMRTQIREADLRQSRSLSDQILFLIIESQYIELIELLGQNPNFHINERLLEGSTYLIVACQIGTFEIVKYLISRGADIDLQDTNGNTALHIALAFNNLKVADYLFSCGAQQNIRNQEGQTPWQMILK